MRTPNVATALAISCIIIIILAYVSTHRHYDARAGNLGNKKASKRRWISHRAHNKLTHTKHTHPTNYKTAAIIRRVYIFFFGFGNGRKNMNNERVQIP